MAGGQQWETRSRAVSLSQRGATLLEIASETSASWEDLEQFQQLCPSFKLEDELFEKVGRYVMWGLMCGRRKSKILSATPSTSDAVQTDGFQFNSVPTEHVQPVSD